MTGDNSETLPEGPTRIAAAERRTFADLAAEWLAGLDAAATTRRSYASALRRFVAWADGATGRPATTRDLTAELLRQYRAALVNAGAAPASINLYVAAVRRWSAWLAARRLIAADPARAALRLVNVQPAGAPAALERPAVLALFREAARGRNAARNYAILAVFVGTGLRLSELAGMRWRDLAMSPRAGWLDVRGKGGKARGVPLSADVRAALACHLAPDVPGAGDGYDLPRFYAAWPAALADGNGGRPVWRTRRGRPLSAKAAGEAVRGTVRECAARGLVPRAASAHTLRHTFARTYLDATGDLVGLAQLLGHASLGTTMRYTRATDEELAARVERAAWQGR